MNIRTLTCTIALLATPALADPPVVENATARQTGTAWTISVTISHLETGTGWDHYADGWEVLAPTDTGEGTSLGLRVLVHPHVDEQPFTRSLSGVTIPDGLSQVLIRARDNTDGWASDRFVLNLSQ